MQLKHLRSPVMVVLAAAACSVLLAYVGRETGWLLVDLVPFLDPDHFRQDWRVVPLAPVLAALASVIACVSLVSERAHAWGRRAVTRFAVLSSASLLLLCSLALHKRLGHTPIDVFLSDLAATTHEIPPPGIAHQEKLPPHVTHASLALGKDPEPPIFYTSYSPGPDGRRESTIGGLMVFQQCWGDGCSVALALTARDFYAQFPPGFSESAWSSYLPSATHQDWASPSALHETLPAKSCSWPVTARGVNITSTRAAGSRRSSPAHASRRGRALPRRGCGLEYWASSLLRRCSSSGGASARGDMRWRPLARGR